MKGLILITPLIAGVSVSAHSALLRGGSGNQPPRRLKSGGTCTSSDDCNKNGSCKSQDPITNIGSCSCDNRYTGDSCDTYIDVDVLSLVVVANSNVRDLTNFYDAVQQAVDDISDLSDSELDDMDDVIVVDVNSLAGVTDDTISTTDLAREIEDLANIDVTRRLKKSGSSSTEEVYAVTGLVLDSDRSLNDDDCEKEIESCLDKIGDKWKLKKIEKLDGTVANLWSCDKKECERALKDAM